MTYQPHYLASFGGVLSSDGVATHTDIWNCNVRLVGLMYNDAIYTGNGQWAQPTTALDPEAILAYCYPLLNTWFHSTVGTTPDIASCFNAASLDYLKINKIAADGTYADKAHTHQHVYPAANLGPRGTTAPWTTTVALSWTTDIARGPGAHGRVYPPVSIAGQAAPVITAQSAANFATFGKNLLNCFTNSDLSGTLPLSPVVASKGKTNVVGGLHPILGCKVGQTMDNQRRRRSAIREVYSPVVPLH